MNPVDRWLGEGDERIGVDGEDFPSIFGSGTKDYYGYSWGGCARTFLNTPSTPRCANNYDKLNPRNFNPETAEADSDTRCSKNKFRQSAR